MDSENDARNALLSYLSFDGTVKPDTRMLIRSSYWALLMDARGTAGRDVESGEVLKPEQSASWLAAMGYLCWFDQVGSVIKRRGTTSKGGFQRCLMDFSSLSGRDASILYSLRPP